MKTRKSKMNRNTNETQISIALDIDGSGQSDISTGIGFLDHMLELFSKHGLFDLSIRAKGDLQVDDHHTVEDLGMTLGQAFADAIGDKLGINRYGFFILPMDEVMTTVAFDFSGRYSFNLDCEFSRENVGKLSTELVYDFWDAFSQNSRSNLIIKSEYARNDHHKIEGIFKACARAIRMSCSFDERNLDNLPSTKGTL